MSGAGLSRTRPRVRVAHVITRLILGGAQENTLVSCSGLLAHGGYDVLLVTGPPLGSEGSLLPDAERRRIRTVVVPSLRRAVHPGHDLEALIRLVGLFLAWRPALVHTHSSKAGILGRVAARLAGVPRVVHTIHGLPFHDYQPRRERWLYTTAERMAGRWADRIEAVGQIMVEKARAARVAPASRFSVVRSGIDVSAFQSGPAARGAARRRYGLEEQDRVVGVLARLEELKGHDDLLDALPALRQAVPRVRLLFLGEGRRRRVLEERLRREGVEDRVVLAGLIPPGEIPSALAACDVVAHTSLREGLPRAIPQALLAGTAVVAYDVDGAREVVEDGATGFLVPPQDRELLARRIIDLLQDPEGAERMAREGRRRVAEEFAEEVVVRALLEDYRLVLRAAPSLDRSDPPPYTQLAPAPRSQTADIHSRSGRAASQVL